MHTTHTKKKTERANTYVFYGVFSSVNDIPKTNNGFSKWVWGGVNGPIDSKFISFDKTSLGYFISVPLRPEIKVFHVQRYPFLASLGTQTLYGEIGHASARVCFHILSCIMEIELESYMRGVC